MLTPSGLPPPTGDDPKMDGWFEKRPDSEMRRLRAEVLYDLAVELRKIGWGDPAYVYDEEHDLFRFRDGRFAFSRRHADWGLLRKRGRLKGRSAVARGEGRR